MLVALLTIVFQMVAMNAIMAQETAAEKTIAATWYEKKSDWNGHDQFHFKIGDRNAYIVVPTEAVDGNPWIWRARFPGYHAEMDIKLVELGFHLAYVDVAGMFGSPKAVAIGNKFYAYVTGERALSKRPVLEGVSRGGLFVYNWAANNPTKVAAIYCDTPVCDIKSWPGGKGTGIGAASEWKQCLEVYGVDEDSVDALLDAVDDTPAHMIATKKIPILHIVAENDRVVPPKENTYLLKKQLEAAGHGMQVISVAEGTEKSNGHHFTHPDPDRVVEFISTAAKRAIHVPTDETANRMALLRGSKRVIFLGDSITQQGTYVTYFDTWLTKQRLKVPPMVINVGLSSETVSGLSEEGHAGGRFPRPDLAERLGRVLDLTKPDLVFACYGINCGIYQPFSEERFAAYKQGIQNLKARVERNGAKLILVTPPTFDDAQAKKNFSYNGVLDKYSDWLVGQRKEGWAVIDLHSAMSAELAIRRQANADYTFQPDSVHPNDDGHLFIAQQLIQWFGGDRADAWDRSLTSLVGQRMQLLRDSYLFTAGHKRPGVKRGLPPAWAKSRAAEVTEQINAMLEQMRLRDASLQRNQRQPNNGSSEELGTVQVTFKQQAFFRRYVGIVGHESARQRIRYKVMSAFRVYPVNADRFYKVVQTIEATRLVNADHKFSAAIAKSLTELEGRTFIYSVSESGDIVSMFSDRPREQTNVTTDQASDGLLISSVLRDDDWKQVIRQTLFQPTTVSQKPFFQKATRDCGRFGSWFGEVRYMPATSRFDYSYEHKMSYLPPRDDNVSDFEVKHGGGSILYSVKNGHVLSAREVFHTEGTAALPNGESMEIDDKQIFTIEISDYLKTNADRN